LRRRGWRGGERGGGGERVRVRERERYETSTTIRAERRSEKEHNI